MGEQSFSAKRKRFIKRYSTRAFHSSEMVVQQGKSEETHGLKSQCGSADCLNRLSRLRLGLHHSLESHVEAGVWTGAQSL